MKVQCRRSEWITCTCTASEQEEEKEKGVPIVATQDSKTKMDMAKVVPSKGVEKHAVEVVKRTIEQLGYRKVNFRSDDEPAILALKESVRRECDAEIV
jgi:hypothetical protein